NLPPDAAPDVEIPGGADRYGVGGSVDGATAARYSAEAAGAGAGIGADRKRAGAGAGHAVAHSRHREEGGLRRPDDGARFLIGRRRGRDRLIGDFDLRQERIERAVLIDRPPVAARYVVARRGVFPAFELLEMRRYRRRLARVIRPDRAAGQG